MGFELKKVEEVVDSAVNHQWGVPEFQRGFVWTRQKVRDLLESLWLGYPVGSFLIWYAPEEVEPRVTADGAQPLGWVVDGQQRSTALCVLYGRRPYWWGADWDAMLARHDIRYNVVAEEGPFFQLASSVTQNDPQWVPALRVLNASDEQLSELVQAVVADLGLPPSAFGKFYSKLDRLRQIKTVQLPVVTVTLDLEDVTEVFSRLNSAGTKVTEADIALALAASQNPGWARTEFLPFIEELDDAGYDVDPNLVFRSMVSIGLGKARLTDVPRGYWSSPDVAAAWTKTQRAWRQTAAYLGERGVLNTDVLPTKNALIPLVVLVDRYPASLGDDRAFAWLLHATRAGRYAAAATTALQGDVRTITDSADLADALASLHEKLLAWASFRASDFLAEYTDRVMRLFLYLLMFDRAAKDWITGQRLGFTGVELLERFNPQWHHIYPRAYLNEQHVAAERWDLFANIAVIAPTTNIKIGDKSPPQYLAKYAISDARLAEQLIPLPASDLIIANFETFLNQRAKALAGELNRYLGNLADLEKYELASGVAAPMVAVGSEPLTQYDAVRRVLREHGVALHYADIAAEVHRRWPELFVLKSPQPSPEASINRAITDTNSRIGPTFRFYGDGVWGLVEWGEETVARDNLTVATANVDVGISPLDGPVFPEDMLAKAIRRLGVDWEYYKQRLPPDRLAIVREIYDRMEGAISEHGLSWQPRLRSNYLGFYRPGGYYCCGINVRKEYPIEFWIKLPLSPAELRSTNADIPDLYPELQDHWDSNNKQWGWKVPTLDLIPDLGKAVELTSRFQPTSGPMQTPTN